MNAIHCPKFAQAFYERRSLCITVRWTGTRMPPTSSHCRRTFQHGLDASQGGMQVLLEGPVGRCRTVFDGVRDLGWGKSGRFWGGLAPQKSATNSHDWLENATVDADWLGRPNLKPSCRNMAFSRGSLTEDIASPTYIIHQLGLKLRKSPCLSLLGASHMAGFGRPCWAMRRVAVTKQCPATPRRAWSAHLRR
jgi:hypothetical protein